MTSRNAKSTPRADNRENVISLRLYTAEQAAELLQVSPAWLRKKATARQVPTTFVGRYLRFSADDITAIQRAGARPADSASAPPGRGHQP